MKKNKVLIVEDNRIVGEDIKQQLTGMGYTVSGVVTSGKKALEAADQNTPDVVIMDIELGEGMNGIDTAAELRRKFQVPIIYLTAYADKETVNRAKMTEPFGYLVKPFEIKELQTTVEIAIFKNRMENRLRESEKQFRSLTENTPFRTPYLAA